jgi:hypothetical protein
MQNRRDAMMGLGQFGLGALTLPGLLRAERADGSPARAGRATAKSCILIFLWGGPPQMDMWDLKPEAPDGIRTHFKPIKTSAAGVEISDQMPHMARVMDRVSLVRSVTHGSDEHEVGVYHMLTGDFDVTQRIPRNNRNRQNRPGPGAVLSCLRPSPISVPSSVTLPRPIQHDGVKYSGTHAGWLGAPFDPVELPDTAFEKGRPVWDFGMPAGVDVARLARRRGLLHAVESADRYLQAHPAGRGIDAYRERAFGLLSSPEARRAMDLEQETPALRDRYGRNHYGEAFLLSRRLVEAGVRLATVNWMFFRPDANPLNPWDNHGGTAALGGVTGYEMLKKDYCIPPLDQAYAALIDDLSARGLLDETLVVMMGEFGRTPKINKTMGRDHWGACQSVVLAGGGIKRGFVYGASDEHAAYPAENPVRPEDLLATLYHAFGIAPDDEIRDQESRPHPVSRGTPVAALFG